MDDYWFVKLGEEEIFCHIPMEYDKTVILQDPLLVQIEEGEQGRFAISLIDYIPYSRNNYIEVNKDKILFKTPLNHDTLDYYFVSKQYAYEVFKKNFLKDVKQVTWQLKNHLKNRDKKISYIHPPSNSEH